MLTRPIVVGALALMLPALASAQSPVAQAGTTEPAAVVFANGGVGSPLTHLDESGSADRKSGFAAGGGVGVQISRYLALRGAIDFLRTEGEDNSIAYAGEKFNQVFFDGDVQLRYPSETGFAPYLRPNEPSVGSGGRRCGLRISELRCISIHGKGGSRQCRWRSTQTSSVPGATSECGGSRGRWPNSPPRRASRCAIAPTGWMLTRRRSPSGCSPCWRSNSRLGGSFWCTTPAPS